LVLLVTEQGNHSFSCGLIFHFDCLIQLVYSALAYTQFFEDFLIFTMDEYFFSDFVDKIGILLDFTLKVREKVGVLFQNIKHLDLKLGKLLLQTLDLFVFFFFLLQLVYLLLIQKNPFGQSHYLSLHFLQTFVFSIFSIFSVLSVLSVDNVVVLHSVETTLFEAATKEGRLNLFAIILSNHGSRSYTATLIEAVFRAGIKLKRVITGLFAVLVAFLIANGLLFDMLVGCDGVGDEAARSDIIDVVVRV